jgi:hypothetical protein
LNVGGRCIIGRCGIMLRSLVAAAQPDTDVECYDYYDCNDNQKGALVFQLLLLIISVANYDS